MIAIYAIINRRIVHKVLLIALATESMKRRPCVDIDDHLMYNLSLALIDDILL